MDRSHPAARLAPFAILRGAGPASRSLTANFALGLAAFVLALLARMALRTSLPSGYPFLTFFPAIILTTLWAGLWPGAMVAALAGAAAWMLFLPLQGAGLHLDSGHAILFYLLNAAIDIGVIHALNQALARLRAEQAVSARLLAVRETMFHELQHRTANNMQFVAALLHAQKRRVQAAPGEAVAAFDEAAARLDSLSNIHRKLYDPTTAGADFGKLVSDLCADLARPDGAPIKCRIDVTRYETAPDRLVALAMITAEMVANAQKHAFTDRAGGTLAVALHRHAGNEMVLTVHDDGPGLPPGFDPARGQSLGMRILQSLAAQLGGRLLLRSDRVGTVAQVYFPA